MHIVQLIKKGGIGIIPTDTLYGVVGSAFSKKAVQRIYTLKGRDENKPFIILVSSISQLKSFGIKHPSFLESTRILWKENKRPTSIILPTPLKKFEYLHRGTQSLAFRLPKNKKLVEFLKKTGPLVAPSANPQGGEPAHTIFEAKKYFGNSVDFYVAGGKKAGKPSRIVSLLDSRVTIVRE